MAKSVKTEAASAKSIHTWTPVKEVVLKQYQVTPEMATKSMERTSNLHDLAITEFLNSNRSMDPLGVPFSYSSCHL